MAEMWDPDVGEGERFEDSSSGCFDGLQCIVHLKSQKVLEIVLYNIPFILQCEKALFISHFNHKTNTKKNDAFHFFADI